jgi:hypothetical protein
MFQVLLTGRRHVFAYASPDIPWSLVQRYFCDVFQMDAVAVVTDYILPAIHKGVLDSLQSFKCQR